MTSVYILLIYKDFIEMNFIFHLLLGPSTSQKGFGYSSSDGSVEYGIQTVSGRFLQLSPPCTVCLLVLCIVYETVLYFMISRFYFHVIYTAIVILPPLLSTLLIVKPLLIKMIRTRPFPLSGVIGLETFPLLTEENSLNLKSSSSQR